MKGFIAKLLAMICGICIMGASEPMIPESEEVEIEISETEELEVSIIPLPCYEMTPEEIAEEEYFDSLEELAICVEAEAGNQSLEGKRMVVDVILNRVDDEDWPDMITEVIEEYPQFSSFWDGGMERVYEPSEETFKAVQMELEERSYPEIYYFTAGGYGKYGTPWKKVGDHYFCTK